MYHPISIFIGLRYFWNIHLPKFKKFITLLSIIGISIGIASLILIISIMNGFKEDFKKNVLSFVPHLIVTNKNQCINQSKFPKNILTFNNFKKFSHILNKNVVIKSKKNITIGEIYGIDASNYDNISNYNIKYILDILKPKQYNAVIGQGLAKKLNINIGDTVKIILLSSIQDFVFKKKMKEYIFKIVDIFSIKNEIDYYQILINKQDSINFLNFSKNYITGWRIWLKNPLDLNIDQIKKTVHPLLVLDWQSQKGELFKAIKIETYMIIFLLALVLLIVFFNIFITFVIYTIEKKDTILILKSQGLLDWKIILIFVTLGSSTSIIGSLIGTSISIILILENDFLQFLIRYFFDNINLPIIIIPSQIFLINIISILLAIFSTLYPSWYAIKSKSSRILSNE